MKTKGLNSIKMLGLQEGLIALLPKQNNKTFLLGYRAKEISLYKTDLKPLGYVWAVGGFVSLAIAIIPNGLGFIFYPLGFGLLGAVGINTFGYKKRIINKLRFEVWRLF